MITENRGNDMYTKLLKSDSFGLSLSEVLELPAFSNHKVLAGVNRLDRNVSCINFLDAPDLSNWAKPNELIITTGFVVKDDESALDNIIPELCNSSLSGICIKPKRFLEKIPTSTINIANNLNMPLIELSPNSQFDEIMKDFFTALLNRQAAFQQQIIGLNELFMKMIISGIDLQKIAEIVAGLVNNTILIYDNVNNRKAYFNKYSLLDFDDINYNEDFDLQTKRFKQKNKYNNFHIKRLIIDKKDYGSIYIWGTENSITKYDISIINSLSLAIALEISREHSLREIENSYFSDFFIHLFNDKIIDISNEKLRARNLGFDDSSTYTVVCIRTLIDQSITSYNQLMLKNNVFNDIATLLTRQDFSCNIVRIGTKYTLIIEIKNMKKYNSLEKVRLYFTDIFHDIKNKYSNVISSIGSGRMYSGIQGIIRSNNEANIALRVSETILKDNIIFYDEMGPYRFIYSPTSIDESNVFVNEIIGKLLKYSTNKREEFINTLDAYFECQGNIQKISEITFTHYNTILYRLKRIEEIVGLNLDNSKERFDLEMALKLYKLIGDSSIVN